MFTLLRSKKKSNQTAKGEAKSVNFKNLLNRSKEDEQKVAWEVSQSEKRVKFANWYDNSLWTKRRHEKSIEILKQAL